MITKLPDPSPESTDAGWFQDNIKIYSLETKTLVNFDSSVVRAQVSASEGARFDSRHH